MIQGASIIIISIIFIHILINSLLAGVASLCGVESRILVIVTLLLLVLVNIFLLVEPFVTDYDVVVCNKLRFEATEEDMVAMELMFVEGLACVAAEGTCLTDTLCLLLSWKASAILLVHRELRSNTGELFLPRIPRSWLLLVHHHSLEDFCLNCFF